MAKTIKVNPAELTSAATAIEGSAAEYRRLFNQLYTDVNGMGAAWQGVDNQAYVQQIDGFKDDFTKMATLMDEYAAFLKQAAETYTRAQEETTSAARRLTN